MKRILMAITFSAAALVTQAQTSSVPAGSKQTPKQATPAKKSATQARGTGQYHGSKDTTPGSPMGTGGAGGNELSGSPAGSASENAIQAEKTDVQADGQVGSQGSKTKKSATKKKTSAQKNRQL